MRERCHCELSGVIRIEWRRSGGAGSVGARRTLRRGTRGRRVQRRGPGALTCAGCGKGRRACPNQCSAWGLFREMKAWTCGGKFLSELGRIFERGRGIGLEVVRKSPDLARSGQIWGWLERNWGRVSWFVLICLGGFAVVMSGFVVCGGGVGCGRLYMHWCSVEDQGVAGVTAWLGSLGWGGWPPSVSRLREVRLCVTSLPQRKERDLGWAWVLVAARYPRQARV